MAGAAGRSGTHPTDCCADTGFLWGREASGVGVSGKFVRVQPAVGGKSPETIDARGGGFKYVTACTCTQQQIAEENVCTWTSAQPHGRQTFTPPPPSPRQTAAGSGLKAQVWACGTASVDHRLPVAHVTRSGGPITPAFTPTTPETVPKNAVWCSWRGWKLFHG